MIPYFDFDRAWDCLKEGSFNPGLRNITHGSL